MSHHILEKQNEEKFLQRLAAQRQIYDEEKRWITAWIVITALVALLGSSVLAFLKGLSAYITLFSALVVVVEVAILLIIRKRGEEAARIQELFDCELLEIPWNEILTKKPDPGTIETAAERFYLRSTPAEKERLKNWYSSRIASMPHHQARVACQMENLLWEEKQRKEYIWWVGGALAVLVVILIVISIAANLSAQEFFAGPVLLAFPIIVIGIKHIYDHHKAITRLIELNQAADTLWQQVSKPDANPAELVQRSRDLQNEIFRHRADNPPVFSWFYKMIQNKYEKMMRGKHLG